VALGDGMRDALLGLFLYLLGGVVFGVGAGIGFQQTETNYFSDSVSTKPNAFGIALAVTGGVLVLIGLFVLLAGIAGLRGGIANLKAAAEQAKTGAGS
jgi:RsiW-degrading membrane proteinase PrsW (M82 family)